MLLLFALSVAAPSATPNVTLPLFVTVIVAVVKWSWSVPELQPVTVAPAVLLLRDRSDCSKPYGCSPGQLGASANLIVTVNVSVVTSEVGTVRYVVGRSISI